MSKLKISTYNVIDGKYLPEILVDKIPDKGDPLEIDKELYFVCEKDIPQSEDPLTIGLIPLVVRDPVKVKNIKEYINCLSIAHRKVQFKNDEGICDLSNCNEMTIS
jgi:hypothetical protein